jgi:hypothetical protein
VVVLERVQSGLLGAALSAFGITGLYFSVVFGECRTATPHPGTALLHHVLSHFYVASCSGTWLAPYMAAPPGHPLYCF